MCISQWKNTGTVQHPSRGILPSNNGDPPPTYTHNMHKSTMFMWQEPNAHTCTYRIITCCTKNCLRDTTSVATSKAVISGAWGRRWGREEWQDRKVGYSVEADRNSVGLRNVLCNELGNGLSRVVYLSGQQWPHIALSVTLVLTIIPNLRGKRSNERDLPGGFC